MRLLCLTNITTVEMREAQHEEYPLGLEGSVLQAVSYTHVSLRFSHVAVVVYSFCSHLHRLNYASCRYEGSTDSGASLRQVLKPVQLETSLHMVNIFAVCQAACDPRMFVSLVLRCCNVNTSYLPQ